MTETKNTVCEVCGDTFTQDADTDFTDCIPCAELEVPFFDDWED